MEFCIHNLDDCGQWVLITGPENVNITGTIVPTDNFEIGHTTFLL